MTASTQATLGTIRVTEDYVVTAAREHMALQLANTLLVEGYHIIAIEVARCMRPIVWVEADHRLAALAAHDDTPAFYYRHGVDTLGPYRIGQLARDGSLVRWMERPGKTTWWRH